MSSSTSPKETASPAPASATYTASCHCNRFVYTVTHTPPLTDPSVEITECNCSICSRNGYLLTYVPDEQVVFEKGSIEEFNKYTFGPKAKIAHYFCGTCGSSCLARSIEPGFFPGISIVNVRQFHDVDLKALKYKFSDGKSYNADS